MRGASKNGRGPDVAEVLEQRADEAMALNQRHLNPQLGRVLRTLGAEGDTLERTLREAEEGQSQSLELAIDERNLRALGFM